MKRLLSIACIGAFVLSACAVETTVRYNLQLSGPDGSADALKGAALRVVERRVAAMKTDLLDRTMEQGSGTTVLMAKLPNKEVADELTRQLQEPFFIELYEPTTESGAGVMQVETLGLMKPTGIENAAFLWVDSRTASGSNLGEVRLRLTPQGHTQFEQVFKRNVGKNLGLFVRGVLVSGLTVKDAKVPEDLTIRGIPTPELAGIFADDVNVGLYVQFTPLP